MFIIQVAVLCEVELKINKRVDWRQSVKGYGASVLHFLNPLNTELNPICQ